MLNEWLHRQVALGVRLASLFPNHPGNAGNQSKGRSKKKAGKRSGIKRSAKVALVVKKKWLDLILEGRKDWEVCGMHTNHRGWIHLAESKASGLLMGRARVVDCKELPRATFI